MKGSCYPNLPGALAQAAVDACRSGWALTSLNGDVPCQEDWQNAPVPKLSQVLEWVTSGRNLGVRPQFDAVGSRLLYLDQEGLAEGRSPSVVRVECRCVNGGIAVFNHAFDHLADAKQRQIFLLRKSSVDQGPDHKSNPDAPLKNVPRTQLCDLPGPKVSEGRLSRDRTRALGA